MELRQDSISLPLISPVSIRESQDGENSDPETTGAEITDQLESHFESPQAHPKPPGRKPWQRRVLMREASYDSQANSYNFLTPKAGSESPGQDPFTLHNGIRYFGGSLYVERFLLLGAWMGLIAAGYVESRLLCFAGLPSDGVRRQDPYDLFDDISKLLQFGFLLGWLARAYAYERFVWMFSWRQWYFPVLFFSTGPLYSLVSNLLCFQHSLVDIPSWGWEMYSLASAGGLAACVTVIWHATAAVRSKSRAEAAVYMCSRAIIFLFYCGAGVLLRYSSHYHALHLHHFYLGWSIAVFAEFNHPISACTLAVGLGIFVQGVGAYSFADMFNDPDCHTAVAPSGGGMICRFQADSRFAVRWCPGDLGAIPDYSCTLS